MEHVGLNNEVVYIDHNTNFLGTESYCLPFTISQEVTITDNRCGVTAVYEDNALKISAPPTKEMCGTNVDICIEVPDCDQNFVTI